MKDCARATDPATGLRLGHVAITVSDADRAAAFYQTLFGLTERERYTIGAANLQIVLLERDAICLELFEFNRHTPLPEYRQTLDSDLRTLGVKHFSFEVDDVDSMYAKAQGEKVDFETDMRFFEDGRRYFFVKDPDGNLVEIMEKTAR